MKNLNVTNNVQLVQKGDLVTFIMDGVNITKEVLQVTKHINGSYSYLADGFNINTMANGLFFTNNDIVKVN